MGIGPVNPSGQARTDLDVDDLVNAPADGGEQVPSMRSTFLRGTVWSIAETWGAKATSLLTFVILGRLLSPEDFGQVALSFVLILVLTVFTDFGASTYLVQQRTLTRRTVDTAFWASMTMSTALFALLWVLAPTIESALDSPGLATVQRLGGVALLLGPFASIPNALLTRAMKFRSMTLRTLLATVAASAVACGMALAGAGVYSLVAQQLVFSAVSIMVVLPATRWRPGLRVDRRELRSMYGYGASIAGTQLLDQSGWVTPNLIIGSVLGPVGLGFYSVASKLSSTSIELFANVFATVSLPVFARLKDDRVRLAQAYGRAVNTGSALSVFMLALLCALSPTLVPLLFGEKWLPSVPLAQLIAVAAVFRAVTYFDRNLLLAADRQRVLLAVSLANAGATVLALLLAAPYGLEVLVSCEIGVALVFWLVQAAVCRRCADAGGLGLVLKVSRNIALGATAALAAGLVVGLVQQPVVSVMAAAGVATALWAALVCLAAPDLRREITSIALRRT